VDRDPLRDGYGVMGGSWKNPIYLYAAFGGLAADASSPALGFPLPRLVDTTVAGQDQGRSAFPSKNRTRTMRHCAGGVPVVARHYRYDSRPLEVSVLETVETPDWTRHRFVTWRSKATPRSRILSAAAGGRAVSDDVYLSSTAAFAQIRSVPEEVELIIAPNIRAGPRRWRSCQGHGRASFGPGWEPPANNSVRFGI